MVLEMTACGGEQIQYLTDIELLSLYFHCYSGTELYNGGIIFIPVLEMPSSLISLLLAAAATTACTIPPGTLSNTIKTAFGILV